MLIRESPRVLAIGAHPDDIEIGAGGFISRLIRDRNAHVEFLILTAGLQAWQHRQGFQRVDRVKEAKRAAKQLGLKKSNVTVLKYEDTHLHEHAHEMIGQIESRLYNRKGSANYDLVLTHAKGDTHSDHRHTHEATISAARYFDGTLLMYQSPSTVPNEFYPAFFVVLDNNDIETKDLAIMAHVSQRQKQFTQHDHTQRIAQAWSVFHRRKDMLEAFEIYKTFWGK